MNTLCVEGTPNGTAVTAGCVGLTPNNGKVDVGTADDAGCPNMFWVFMFCVGCPDVAEICCVVVETAEPKVNVGVIEFKLGALLFV